MMRCSALAVLERSSLWQEVLYSRRLHVGDVFGRGRAPQREALARLVYSHPGLSICWRSSSSPEDGTAPHSRRFAHSSSHNVYWASNDRSLYRARCVNLGRKNLEGPLSSTVTSQHRSTAIMGDIDAFQDRYRRRPSERIFGRSITFALTIWHRLWWTEAGYRSKARGRHCTPRYSTDSARVAAWTFASLVSASHHRQIFGTGDQSLPGACTAW